MIFYGYDHHCYHHCQHLPCGRLGLAAVLCLIAFLIAKELLDAGVEVEAAGETATLRHPWVKPLSRTLSVGIAPLLIVFGFIVLVKVMEVL